MILGNWGEGLIGANFVLDWLSVDGESVISLDKLTYAGNLENLNGLMGDLWHNFERRDIGDGPQDARLQVQHQPRAVVNLQPGALWDGRCKALKTSSRPTSSAPFARWSPCGRLRGVLAEPDKGTFPFPQVSTHKV